MIRTQIYLGDRERKGVARLAKATGATQSEVIRKAISAYLESSGSDDRLTKLRNAKGMWRGRRDLDLSQIREDFDRY